MRRTLLALAVAAACVGWTPATSYARPTCAEGFEVLCLIYCPAPPKVCSDTR